MPPEPEKNIVTELGDAAALGLHPPYYLAARLGGATRDEIIAATTQAVPIHDYSQARVVGADHTQALVAHRAGCLADYSLLRRSGASHADALGLATAGLSLALP